MQKLDLFLIFLFGLAVFEKVCSVSLGASTTPSTPNNDDDDDWDDEESSEVEDEGKIYKNPRNSPSTQCPRDEEQATLLGQKCLRKCFSDEDCKSKKKKCLCDGACGMSCIKPDRECPEPGQIPYGSVQASGKLFGARASYTCQHGYHVVGLKSRTCQGDGQWAGQAPACKQNIYCLSPPTIDHARHNALPEQATFDLDSTLQYYCHTGYVTNGFPRAKCLEMDGQASWYGPDISCEPRSCGAPPDISHGWHAGECYTFGCRITYHCAESYELVGKNEKYCQPDGTWTPKEVPTCVLVTAVQCPPPENPRHGKAIYTSCSYNSVVRYECKYGYTLVGDSTRRCGADRKWSSTQPVCKEINCGHPGRLWNGWLENIEGGTGLGASIIFRCHEGMLLEGNSSTVCQIDGKWRYPLPKCFAPCVVPHVTKGRVILLSRNDTAPTSTVVSHGEILSVHCEARYEFISQQEHVTCNNGTWTQMPKCEPAKCQTLPKSPKHGMVSAPDMKHGMKAKFRCKDGFELKGNAFVECSFGNWTGQSPRCEEVFCPYPGLVQNGKILLVGNMALYDYRPYVKKVQNNKQIMYDCEKGYLLMEGPAGATCIGGRWSPAELPKCVEAEHPRFRFNVRRRRSIMEKYKRAFIRNSQHIYNNAEKRKLHTFYHQNMDYLTRFGFHKDLVKKREKRESNFEEHVKFCPGPPQLLLYPPNDIANYVVRYPPGFTIIFDCRNNRQLKGSSQTTCVNGRWKPSDRPICHQGVYSDLYALELVPSARQRAKREISKQNDSEFDSFKDSLDLEDILREHNYTEKSDQPLSRKPRYEFLPLLIWKLLKLLKQQDPSLNSVIMPTWCAYGPNQTCHPRNFMPIEIITSPRSNQHPDRIKRSNEDLQQILLHHDYLNTSDLPVSRKPRVDGLPVLEWYLRNVQKRNILRRRKRALSLGLRRYGDRKRRYIDRLFSQIQQALRLNPVSKRTLLNTFPPVYSPKLYVRDIRTAGATYILLDQLRHAMMLKNQHQKRLPNIIRKKRALKGGGGSRAVGLSRVGGSGGGHSVRRGNKGSNSVDEEDEIPDPDATHHTSVPTSTIKKPKTNKTRGGPCDPLQNEPFVNIEFVKHSKDSNSTWGTGTTVRLACGIGYILNMAENQTAKCSKGKWKPKKPQCIIVPCYVPETPYGIYNIAKEENVTDSDIDFTQPLNSTMDVPNGIVVEFSCESGYAVQGSSNMRCWHGDWAVTAFPECTPAPCQLPKIYHGQYNEGYKAGLNIANGSLVTYQCDEEYIPAEEQLIECQLGELHPKHPVCRRADGTDSPEDHYLGGGDLVKGGDITVIEYGNSNGKSCGPPAKVRGSLIYRNEEQIGNDENSFPDGSEVTFNCIESIMGEKTTWKIICEDGSWIGRSLNCDLEELMSAQTSSNNSTCIFRNQELNVVSFYNDQMIKEDVVEFPAGAVLVSRCVDIGKFAMFGPNRRRCMGGDWDESKPSCYGLNQEHDYSMEKPPTILFRHENGPIAQSNDGKLIVYPGTVLHMECLWIRRFGTPKWNITHDYRKYQEGWTTDEGRDSGLEYRLSIMHATKDDAGIFTCITPARYTHSVEIVVKAVHCPTLPERRGLTANTKSTKMNTVVKFDCVNGNALIGAPEIVCLPSGNWSAPFPVCESIECGEVTDLSPHLKVLVLSREVGGKAVFSCESGYGLRGPAETVCQHSGDWAVPFPSCQEVHCDDPKPPENGYIQGSGPYKAGDVVQFNCNPDYMMEGQPIIACQENSRWSGKHPKCIQACSYPGTTISGRMSSVKFFYKIGENITFSCEEGLILKGAAMLRCLKNGKWSNAIPTCVSPESVKKREIYYG